MKRFLLALLGAFIGCICAALVTLFVSFPISAYYDAVGGSGDERTAGAFLLFYVVWPILTLLGVVGGAMLGYRFSKQ